MAYIYAKEKGESIVNQTYKNLDKYREENKFVQWISTITANLCKDYLKSSKFKFNNNKTEIEAEYDNLCTKTTPEKELTSKERQKIILKALDSLPKKMREAIILYEYEDYSYEKISQKLNVPVGTVKSRINSARNILKDKLSFLIEDED